MREPTAEELAKVNELETAVHDANHTVRRVQRQRDAMMALATGDFTTNADDESSEALYAHATRLFCGVWAEEDAAITRLEAAHNARNQFVNELKQKLHAEQPAIVGARMIPMRRPANGG
jgi:hypothetical protein